jgi:hypothetical protein
MGIYAKVRGAKTTGGGNYFEPDADWVVMVNAVKDIETRDEKPAFIVECKVLESTCERVKPGAERSWFVDMLKDAAAGNVKHFVMVATEQLTGEAVEDEKCEACEGSGKVGKLGCKDCDGTGMVSAIDEAGILEICSERQPYAGLILGLTTFNKPTREGKPFTRHKWTLLSSVQETKYEEVAVGLGLKKAA